MTERPGTEVSAVWDGKLQRVYVCHRRKDGQIFAIRAGQKGLGDTPQRLYWWGDFWCTSPCTEVTA